MERADYLDHVIALSREKMHEGQGGPFAAIVVRDDAIIGEGWNQVTSACDPTAHAEIQAIRSACDATGEYALQGATVYVNCEPCPMCLAAMYWARVDRVVFASTRDAAARAGFDDARIYAELELPPAERSLITEHVPREEALAVFAEWADKDDKVPY